MRNGVSCGTVIIICSIDPRQFLEMRLDRGTTKNLKKWLRGRIFKNGEEWGKIRNVENNFLSRYVTERIRKITKFVARKNI